MKLVEIQLGIVAAWIHDVSYLLFLRENSFNRNINSCLLSDEALAEFDNTTCTIMMRYDPNHVENIICCKNVINEGQVYRVLLPSTKAKVTSGNTRTTGPNMVQLVRKYIALCPTSIDHGLFFVSFHSKKCTKQLVRIHMSVNMPKTMIIQKILIAGFGSNRMGHQHIVALMYGFFWIINLIEGGLEGVDQYNGHLDLMSIREIIYKIVVSKEYITIKLLHDHVMEDIPDINVGPKSLTNEDIPQKSWTKTKIIAYLNKNGIDYPSKAIKDQMEYWLTNNGRWVLRLPLYYCHFNALEVAWSEVKRNYDRFIPRTSSSPNDVCATWQNVTDQVPAVHWNNYKKMQGSHTCSVHECAARLKPIFRFPHPNRGLDRFLAWVKAANNPKFVVLTHDQIHRRGYICFQHFQPEDYVPGTQRLRRSAVPTILPPRDDNELRSSLEADQIDVSNVGPQTIDLTFLTPEKECPYFHAIANLTPRTRRTPSSQSLATKLETLGGRSAWSTGVPVRQLNFGAEEDGINELPGAGPSGLQNIPKIDFAGNFVPARQSVDTSKSMTKTPRKILDRLGIKGTTVNFSSNETLLYVEAKRLQRQVGRLQRQAQKRKSALHSVKQLLRDRQLVHLVEGLSPLQQRFFNSQIRNVNRKPKGRSFTFEEKVDAIAIWKHGPKTYKLLSRMFTLPSIDTLRATLNKVPIEPGINKPIFEVLRKQVCRRMDSKYNLCTLIFDEMSIQPHLDYLPCEDRVVGFEDDGTTRSEKIADHVCVFMLRGIFKRWKQPVAFAFCKNSMSAANIVRFYKEIVKEATAVGLNIIASVCDQGTTNSAAINMLLQETKRRAILGNEEEVEENVIRIGDHEVIPLFDPPHLLKSMRNNLLTKDLLYVEKSGVERRASWSFFEKAYDLDHTEGDTLRVMTKITIDHVKPNLRGKKMKVRYASQVFSSTVAKFIYLCSTGALGGSIPPDARYTCNLFLFMDSVFDSVNGGFGDCGGKKLRQMVGDDTLHHSFWLEGKRMFSNMRFEPRKSGDRAKPPVLQGWYRTLNGFMLIKETLKKLGYNSFPARAFNQDPLENFFGQLRQYGVRYTNPSCKAFVPFYKSLMMKNFCSYHSRGSNCEQDDESFVVSIREFLSLDINRKCIEDQWKPPPVPDTVSEDNFYDQNVIGYIGGFLVKHMPKPLDCEICRFNLIHDGVPNIQYHGLVVQKEYDGEKRRLQYANVEMIKTLIKIYNHLVILVPSAIYHPSLSQRLISHLRITVDFDFRECLHTEELKAQLFHLFIRVYIFRYMKKLSNFVFGKEEPNKSTSLERQMQQLYLRFKKRKRTFV
ncbi:uncharacterized protein LOC135127759 [Zophobas morio]|uniref:uncharacterized protein LOC135127759 n=2 Tax=Zophobas morio TaxID=2755281 RepID=UPI0030834FA8